MRLGFHYHIPMYRNEVGELKTPGYLGVFLDALAEQCDELVCFLHSPRSEEIPFIDYKLRQNNITWVSLGPRHSVPIRMLRSYAIVQPIRDWRNKLDALLIRGPSPLLPTVASAARDLPLALLLVGDYVAGVKTLPQPTWRKAAIGAWSLWNQHQQLKVAQKAFTFVNSHLLYEQLKRNVPLLYETRTTTLSSLDAFEREDTCTKRPIHLLYTGRLDKAKGILDMVEALVWLVTQGEDVVLDLVGRPQKGDNVLDQVWTLAQERGVQERIFYHGYKPIGPELFAYYRNADIYVIASQASEGFPRTIWEALAHSLPVVATKVGSIPLFLRDETTALLVEPNDWLALAQAISRVSCNSVLRQLMIQQGREVAKENTLDRRTREMLSQIQQWLSMNKTADLTRTETK